MRKIFAIILLALLLGVGVVAVIETDPGYVLLSYGNYTLETSLWVGLLLLVLFVLAIYVALNLLYRLIGGQRSLVNWLGTRKTHHAMRLSTRGLVSYTEGNWDKARSQLLRGAQKNEAPLVNYLLAARSSGQLQESEKVHEYLHAAVDAEPTAKVAAEITLAEIKLDAAEYEQALAALKQARLNVNRHPNVLNLLRRGYEGLQDWDALLELLPDLKKHKQLTTDAFAQLEREVHCRRLEQSAVGAAASVDDLNNAWQKLPTRLKQDAAVLNGYVRLLIGLGDHAAAGKSIVRALKHQWDSNLVRQYGFVEGDNLSRQLTEAETWLPSHTEDPQLLLCLGRLSARDKLWGKARDYFESSYRLQPSAETCAELGRLLTALGEPNVAAAYFREGLMMQERDLPTLPMPEKITSHGQLLARS